LREALTLGIDHIDTSDFYGPHVTNRLIREALHPYPANLTLVTKIGAWRNDEGDWILEHGADFLRRSVEDNLERLGLERMAIVNLRIEGPQQDVAGPMRTMRKMQEEGLLEHIGISTVDMAQLRAARDIAPIVCVQNHYNLVHRDDDAMIDDILNTPKRVSGTSALRQAEKASASTRRVSEGRMMPSSQSRAVA
jgi:pyridoxine 4-dehydrogenase